MSLRALRTLIAIAERGSFASAASALHMSQSAISMQMKSLEDELGARLFDRSRRPPALNERGLALLERAREVVALYARMSEAVSDPDDLAGNLSIGAVPTALTGMLPAILASLRKSHPRLQIRVAAGLSGDLVLRVARGEIDCALVTEPERPLEGLFARPVGSEPFVVIAPRAAAGKTDRDLLENHPFIRFNRQAWVGRVVERSLRERDIAVREAMELDSLEAIERMVLAGLGVSVVPERAGAPLPKGLRRVPFGAPPLARKLCLVERERNPKRQLTAALHDALVAGRTGR